jgi:hypothetical protein
MKTRKKRAVAIAQSRSRKKPMPEIWVHYQDDRGFGVQAHAHLQVPSDGYLYLVWREGAKIERRYLGKPCRELTKAQKSSTTGEPPAGARRRARPAPGPGPARRQM